ncbi:MAG: NAD-dependent epimerase/dehydratase family protein [Deltaproteobacteria bacterium]|nr:NAD-dependent epimerase/dehydratase family protein [Deltaproteobacteria bacterium]
MAYSPLILITGATGAVGPLVVKAFHDASYSIRTLSIDPPPVNMWPDDVEALIGDVTDSSVVRAAMEGVEMVIHLAALLHIVNPPLALKEKYERINVGGTATVVGAAIKADVRRVVFFSTIAVYGQSDGRIVTENTPPRPDTFYAKTKREAEEIVLEAKRADGRRLGTVLRLGAVYGGRIKGNYQRLVQSLARGRFVPVGNGSNRRTLVYDKDVARAAVVAASHDAAAGKIFNVSDGRFHTMNEIIGTICAAIGHKVPRLSLPVGVSRIVAGIIEKGGHSMGLKPPAIRAMIDKYTEDIAMDGSLIQKELGFVPHYDLKTGWEETVKEMREGGAL